MALRIPCPTCGDRSVLEFRFGGEVPEVPDGITDPAARDLDRGWMRTNALGVVTERWFHEAGCRRWLTLVRDTTDDRVVGLAPE
jgi:sarcosine oxidase, subunit delta